MRVAQKQSGRCPLTAVALSFTRAVALSALRPTRRQRTSAHLHCVMLFGTVQTRLCAAKLGSECARLIASACCLRWCAQSGRRFWMRHSAARLWGKGIGRLTRAQGKGACCARSHSEEKSFRRRTASKDRPFWVRPAITCVHQPTAWKLTAAAQYLAATSVPVLEPRLVVSLGAVNVSVLSLVAISRGWKSSV